MLLSESRSQGRWRELETWRRSWTWGLGGWNRQVKAGTLEKSMGNWAKAGVSHWEPGAQREQVVETGGGTASNEMPPKAEKAREISWLLLSFCPAVFQHHLPLDEARHHLAKEPGNCSFQSSTFCDAEQTRESIGMDLRTARQIISTDTKGKWYLSGIKIATNRGVKKPGNKRIHTTHWYHFIVPRFNDKKYVQSFDPR